MFSPHSLFFFLISPNYAVFLLPFYTPGLRHVWKSLICLDRKKRAGYKISVRATNNENT